MSTATRQSAQEQHPRAFGRRLLGLVFATLTLVLMVPAAPAWAHAELLSTTPAAGEVLASAPSSVTFAFDEPVFVVPDGFRLYDDSGAHRTVPVEAEGRRVRASLPADLAAGSYVLGWRVISDDSHAESGVLSFSVGTPSASAPTVVAVDTRAVDLLSGTLTTLGYLGLFCLVGFTIFDLFIARAAPSGRRVCRGAGLIAVSAYLVLVPLTVARERGLSVGSLVDPTVFFAGWTGGAAATLLLAALGVVLMALRSRLPRRGGFWAGAVGASVGLLSVLPVGHTRTFGPAWLVVGADVIHAATAAVWLGGLTALILYLAHARRERGQAGAAAAVVGRFSTVAGGLVVLLGVTGIVLAVVIVGSFPALVGSVYGRLLLIKLSLVGVIGVLAGWNRYRVIPRLVQEPAEGRAWRRLVQVMRLEVCGLVLVVGLAAVITMQNPRQTDGAVLPSATRAAWGIPVLADLGTGHLTGRFSPGIVGANVITFDLTDAGGAPMVPLDLPIVSVSEPNLSLGPLPAEVVSGTVPGSYRATIVLPAVGQWTITAAVRVTELERPAAVTEVVVVRGG